MSISSPLWSEIFHKCPLKQVQENISKMTTKTNHFLDKALNVLTAFSMMLPNNPFKEHIVKTQKLGK